MAKPRALTAPNASEDVELQEFSFVAGKDEKWCSRGFPGGTVVKTPCSHRRGPGFDPQLGN